MEQILHVIPACHHRLSLQEESSTGAPTSKFRFLDLAPELRNEVYKIAFRTPIGTEAEAARCNIGLPAFALTAYQWETTADKKHRHLVHVEFPECIPVNKQFVKEATFVFAKDKVFEISAHIDDIDKEDGGDFPTTQPHRLLIEAICSTKAPYITNGGARSPNPALLQISDDDTAAMLVFRNLRKDRTLPLDLVLEWTYDLHPYPSYDNPIYKSALLET